jgi:hypothetical protein
MRRLRFIIPEEGIVHSSIRACIRFQPLERSVAKIGDIFPKLAVILFCSIYELYARYIRECNADLHAAYSLLVKMRILTPKWSL